MARRFKLSEAVARITMSDSDENDDSDSADDLEPRYNDPNSDYEDHISENNQSGDSSSSSSSDESSDTEKETELSMRTSKDGLIWTYRASGRGQRPACNVIRIAPGLARPVDTIFDAFKLFISADIVDPIVEHSNSRARAAFEIWNQNHPDNQKQWVDITVEEFYGFIGLLLLMGVLRSRKESVHHMWSAQKGFCRPVFAATMSRDRFVSIKRYLRFDDLQTRVQRRQDDKLAAIREIFERFVRNCKESMNPTAELTIDEHFIAFRGNCPFRVYMPTKPGKYGIKVWCLADNSNSYAANLQVYTGLGPDGQREQNQGARVVRDLTGMLQGGYGITTDNFFTGVALAKELKQQKNCTLLGTMRKTKKDVPPALRETKGRPVHSSKFLYHEGLTMVSYIPKKNRNVILLSSQHQGEVIDEEHDFKPEIIMDYNKTKSAVDTLDKLVREYRCLRTSRRWPLALFFDLIDIAGHNAFCAWLAHEPDYNVGKSHRRRLFLMQLAEDMVKPLIEGRAANPVGLQEPILAAIRIFVPVEHRTARHVRPQDNKAVGRCAICGRGQDRKSRAKCDRCKNFICKEHSEKKTVTVCDDCAAGAV